MEQRVWAVVGLGNPGDRYADTRHNVGFMVLDRLAADLDATFKSFKESQLAKCRSGETTLYLAKPQTYMNLSGRAVRSLMDYFRLEADQLLVVYDDVALPLGRIRIRKSGSAGGQKGMKSILSELGTQQICRLRLGVAPDHDVSNLSSFVLGRFAKSERRILETILTDSVTAIRVLVSEGPDVAMQRFNGVERPN